MYLVYLVRNGLDYDSYRESLFVMEDERCAVRYAERYNNLLEKKKKLYQKFDEDNPDETINYWGYEVQEIIGAFVEQIEKR